MKRFITILILSLTAIVSNAQQRVTPMFEVNTRTYMEVIQLITELEQTSMIDKIVKSEPITTTNGEIQLRKYRNSIKIIHSEFTSMVEGRQSKWYDTDCIKTELIIQNTKMYEYISKKMSGNPRIKSMYIEVSPKGVAFIRVNYYKL